MKRLNKIKRYAIAVPVLIFLFLHCEYKGPASPWAESQKEEKVQIEITSIDPVIAGAASEITILGKNFSTVISDNAVYFDNAQCVIKSCTENAIVVYRPNIVGDSLTIKVTRKDGINVAKHAPYKLETVVESYGQFADTEAMLAECLDANENVFIVMSSMSAIRINADGIRDASYQAGTGSSLWTDMKTGFDGAMYMARSNQIIYHIAAGSDTALEYSRFPDRTKDRVESIDFDQNGNLFCGGKKSGLMVMRSDKSTQQFGFYDDYDILTVRVYNGFVYVAALYSGTGTAGVNEGIWRHLLNTDGTVGSQELVLDYGISPYANAALNDMTISADGKLYLGITHPETPIVKYNPNDGSFSPLFVNLIASPVEQLVWGNSTYLYALIGRSVTISNGGQLLKINTGELGAPYYGR
jgi:hypothetical protein